MGWSDIFGFLFTRRDTGTSKRAKETGQALREMQSETKGTNRREQGMITQVTPNLLPYDRWNQRWKRKELLEQVNRYVRTDPRLARANQRKAQATIGQGITVTVQGSHGRSKAARLGQQAQEIINQVMRDARINAKLVSWSRLLLREGELDLNIIVDHTQRRIIGINRLPTGTIMRNEDEEGRFPDLDRAFTQVDPLTQVPLKDPATGMERHFPLYALNSIRYQYDDGELYGVPAYAPAVRYASRLEDTEDHMFIRRMVRAGLKLLFSVVRADGSPADWSEVQKIRDENKEFEDPKRIKESVAQNLWANQQVNVKEIQGDANLDEIEDVQHFEDQLWVASETPKGLLGYGQHINRDVLKEQQEEYNKDLDHLCFLLEHGDGGPYSGLRAIFDFALAMQGINPESVSFAIQWTEHTTETKDERADYVLKLKEKGMISKRKALHLLSNDLGLETEADIDALIAEMDEENDRAPGGDPGPVAGDAPRESLSDLAGLMERRVRDRGRRVWRRVQRHPELHSLLEAVAGDLATWTTAVSESSDSGQLHDSACTCDYHTVTDDGDEDLPASVAALLALLDESLGVDRMTGMQATYLQGARRGAAEASILAHQPYRGLPRGVAAAVSEGMRERWAGIDATTLNGVRRELRLLAGQATTEAGLERLIQAVLEMPDWRVQTVAVTELVWGYHLGALGVYQQAGVEYVRRNELPSACPGCMAADGDIHLVGEAAGILPAHPRCYGWWSPVTQ